MTYANIKNYRERGFTIVELLIVIIVIGILATLVLIAYNNVQGQARDTKRSADANSITDTAETYKTQSSLGYYPPATYGQSTPGTDFQTAIGTGSNYTSGTVGVSINSSVTGNLNKGASASAAMPSSGNPNNYEIVWCGGADNTTATGAKVFYWQESKSNPLNTSNPHVFWDITGTGCTNTPNTP